MLLGHARGKVGSLVFSRVNGQQVTRARAEVVKNPQTDSQMIQRILLNTVAQAYSKMSAIVDHSFEGIQPGQKSMSYFMKSNLNTLREVLAKDGDITAAPPYVSPINSNLFAMNTYEVAKGTLPDVNPSIMHSDGIYIGAAANTYQAVLDYYGLQRGDQLTFLICETNDYTTVSFKYSRVILDPREDDGTEAPLSTAFVTGTAITKPNPKNEANGVQFKFEESSIKAYAANDNIGGAVIASRQKVDGTWLRSNSKLVVSEDGGVGFTVEDALNDFKSGGLEIISPRYLNNASRGGNAGASAPAANEVTVTLEKNPANGGTVSGGGVVRKGSSVTVTASPSGTYSFAGWYNGATLMSTNASYTFTANADITLTAEFEEPNGD